MPAPTSYSSGSLQQVRALEAAHRFSLSMIDLREGNISAAASRVAGIDDLAPHYATLFNAEALLTEGQVHRAIAICENAPGSRTPYMSDTEGMLTHNLPALKDTLARAYEQAGEFYKAIEEYERLLTVGPTTHDRRLAHPRYRFRLAELYERKGWSERARDQYGSFLEIWRDAEKELPEVSEAQARVAQLG